MERCTRCVLPRNYPLTDFDEHGVCEYCRGFAPRQPLGTKPLLEAIAARRQPGSKYDCVVALSGGRDSTFALHYLVRKLGLRVGTFTVDHAYLPEQTQENIANAVRVLGVDHEIYRHDLSVKAAAPMLRAWLHRPDAAMVSSVCLGCRLALHEAMDASAARFGAVCISGAGEPGNDDYFGARFFTRHWDRTSGRAAMVAGYGLKLLRNPRYVLNRTMPAMMAREYATVFAPSLVRRTKGPGSIALFYFVPWDEDEIMTTITGDLGWKRSSEADADWRSDCKLAVLKNQMYLHTLGFTKNDVLVGALVRMGRLTREEGIRRLERENQPRPELVSALCSEIAGRPVDGQWAMH